MLSIFGCFLESLGCCPSLMLCSKVSITFRLFTLPLLNLSLNRRLLYHFCRCVGQCLSRLRIHDSSCLGWDQVWCSISAITAVMIAWSQLSRIIFSHYPSCHSCLPVSAVMGDHLTVQAALVTHSSSSTPRLSSVLIAPTRTKVPARSYAKGITRSLGLHVVHRLGSAFLCHEKLVFLRCKSVPVRHLAKGTFKYPFFRQD